MIDEKKLIEELQKRIRTPRSTMEIVRDIIPLVEMQPKVGEWIPCSLGVMPPEKDSIFKKFKGTDKWKDAMFEKTSSQVQVTIEFEDGKRMTSVSHTIDGKWRHELEPYNSSRVIAWKPLSEPYQEEVTE